MGTLLSALALLGAFILITYALHFIFSGGLFWVIAFVLLFAYAMFFVTRK